MQLQQGISTRCCANIECPKSAKSYFLNNLKSCAKCKSIYYCSLECQKLHWKLHKANCFSRYDESEIIDDSVLIVRGLQSSFGDENAIIGSLAKLINIVQSTNEINKKNDFLNKLGKNDICRILIEISNNFRNNTIAEQSIYLYSNLATNVDNAKKLTKLKIIEALRKIFIFLRMSNPGIIISSDIINLTCSILFNLFANLIPKEREKLIDQGLFKFLLELVSPFVNDVQICQSGCFPIVKMCQTYECLESEYVENKSPIILDQYLLYNNHIKMLYKIGAIDYIINVLKKHPLHLILVRDSFASILSVISIPDIFLSIVKSEDLLIIVNIMKYHISDHSCMFCGIKFLTKIFKFRLAKEFSDNFDDSFILNLIRNMKLFEFILDILKVYKDKRDYVKNIFCFLFDNFNDGFLLKEFFEHNNLFFECIDIMRNSPLPSNITLNVLILIDNITKFGDEYITKLVEMNTCEILISTLKGFETNCNINEKGCHIIASIIIHGKTSRKNSSIKILNLKICFLIIKIMENFVTILRDAIFLLLALKKYGFLKEYPDQFIVVNNKLKDLRGNCNNDINDIIEKYFNENDNYF